MYARLYKNASSGIIQLSMTDTEQKAPPLSEVDCQMYRIIGERVRTAREKVKPKLSQSALARKLKVHRVSIVNIEAGRQHAPLHLLRRIAEVLNTEMVLLIPRREDYQMISEPIDLDDETIAKIESAAIADPEAQRLVARFVGRIKARTQANP